ncbi:uncharacterized protein LOC119723371 isoform X2 [Patiria miniata]|nr:uncharacterized protein LOC119723371 isoform X2 [Patiria miniata]XP_038049903.1 uncharacterized protein LOC119723371 isoform X2 [Patiria miniata]
MSTNSVTVEVVSENSTKWVTLKCQKSVNAYELSRLITDRSENQPKPEQLILRDRHGARLQPNNKINKVNDRSGTHLIAEMVGEGGVQRVDGRQHDKAMSSDSITSCTDDSEDVEDLTKVSSTEDSEDPNTPTKSKRRKVESEESPSTIDLSNYASPPEIEASNADPTKKIQTKRKSRTRMNAKAALQTITDDSSSHGEGQCQGCRKPVDGSPTPRPGLKRRLESDQSPTRGSQRVRPRVSHMCTCCDDRQEKTSLKKHGKNTPNSKRNLTHPSPVPDTQVIEVGEDSPEKSCRDTDVKTPKEERLSHSMRKIHLEDGTDSPDGNSLCATQSVTKKLGESATRPESAMTLNYKTESTLEKTVTSIRCQDSTDSEHSDVALISDLADAKTDSVVNQDVCDSTGTPSSSIPNDIKAKDAATSVIDVPDTRGKDVIAIQVDTPTNNIPSSPGGCFIVVPASASSLSTTANRNVRGGVSTSKLVTKVSNQCLVKPVVSAGSTIKTISNIVNCITVPINKATGQSPGQVAGILVNQANTPVNPVVTAVPKGTIICEITLTKHVPTTPTVSSTVDRSCSRVLKTYPGKARRTEASKKLATRANSKSEINLICVDADGCEENSSVPADGGDSQPSKTEGEPDPNEADPILVNIGKNELRKSDLDTLEEGEWLNDCVINAYFFLLSVVSPLKVFTHSSFFFFSLVKRGYEGVKRWTKNVDLFTQDLIFIPVHNKSHWSLVVVHIKEGIIEYYNSSTMLDGYPRSMMHIRDYLKSEAKHREKAQFSDIKWEMYVVGDIPRQQNMDDCGLFICQYAKRLSWKQKVRFDIKESINLRRQMHRELLRRKIEAQ